MSIRFNLPFWEMLQQKHGIKTATDAADFFEKLYDKAFNPIPGNPVMERNILPGITLKRDDSIPPGEIHIKNVPRETFHGKLTRKQMAKIDEQGQMPPILPEKTQLEPPPGLKGIELRIWQEEQKEKQKNSK